MINSHTPRLTLDSFCALWSHLRAKHCQPRLQTLFGVRGNKMMGSLSKKHGKHNLKRQR